MAALRAHQASDIYQQVVASLEEGAVTRVAALLLDPSGSLVDEADLNVEDETGFGVVPSLSDLVRRASRASAQGGRGGT